MTESSYHEADLAPQQTRDILNHRGTSTEPRSANSAHHSPTVTHFPQHSPTYSTSHAHPPSRYDSIAKSSFPPSTNSPTLHHDMNGYSMQATTISMDRPISQEVSGKGSLMYSKADRSLAEAEQSRGPNVLFQYPLEPKRRPCCSSPLPSAGRGTGAKILQIVESSYLTNSR